MLNIPKQIGPFNFDIRMTEKQRQHRLIIKVLSASILISAFLIGCITVYTNSYNIMNKDKMIVFDYEKTDDETVITVMNKEYHIEK